jgi:hypothetical protein
VFFDPLYFILLGPPMLLALWATFKVKRSFHRASKIRASSGMSGAEAAARILERSGLYHVGVEPTNGFLGDHYDPRAKVLRLSPAVYQGRSLAAVGVAAHEAGHALQDQAEYAPLGLRNAIVPMAGFGSNASFLIFFLGMIMQFQILMVAAIVLFSAVVVFQLVNLPVEFNASSRARALLVDHGIIQPQEDREVGKVLNAAAMTYVAGTLTAIATLIYYILRSGLLGGRN